MRYLGQKPSNWPAATLVFGWMALAIPLFLLGGGRVISLFGRGLAEPPLFWWPGTSALGFFLSIGPMVLGALALYLMPRVDWSPRVGTGLVALGVLSAIAGIAWDAGSGVAVYADRVVHRAAGFGQAIHVDRFSDARRIETSCVVTKMRRGPWHAEPQFTLVFRDGRGVELWNRGLGGAGSSWPGRLPAISRAHQTAHQAGAARAPARKPDGALIGDIGCVEQLAEQLDVPLLELAPLFVVDQSELRPGEYAGAGVE